MKHGISSKPDGGNVLVMATAEANRLCLEVKDDGLGAPLAEVENATGHGLHLLRQQLLQAVGPEGSLALDTAEGRGFTATLEVPLEGTATDANTDPRG